ncbi:hypothetical protein SGUI_2899 [Serinicoccus hydrothermalis]|uniref:Histone deacetylase n=1 Tax=Serinicoccus hydrothermalis TaxID=1758689 RepID=A0A1B1NFV1_9MICO|nr:histone deacetylase [Serinicoccus hydrothermalis]ANS80295.1 hypothetical protein SGUI_2899 [Serinicoccus hydrothermalis]
MLLWYAAYGSNMHRDRLLRYLQGGRPDGARRTYVGARDAAAPLADAALSLPGSLRFAGESLTWGGGVAFYDPDAAAPEDRVLARAYLITEEQFADVAAQEMHRAPGEALELATVLGTGRHAHGPGRYETLHHVGEREGRPVLTFTADRPGDLPANPPVGAYLRTMARGWAEAHGMSTEEVVDHLWANPQVRLGWDRTALHDLLTGAPAGS